MTNYMLSTCGTITRMDTLELIRINLFSPMVLAFLLGIIAVLVGNDLRIPPQVYSIISIYLLLAIGLKGGFDLAKSPLGDFWGAAAVAIIVGGLIPLWSYAILRYWGGYDPPNAIALGIHYGAVSAVTLSACITFLNEVGQSFEGFMPTMYVIMELPAVAVGLTLANGQLKQNTSTTLPELLQSALTGKSFLLLGGGVIIGYVSGDTGASQVSPFFVDLFPGFLTLFLLEMGTLVGHRLSDLRHAGWFLIGFGLVMPFLHAALAIILSTYLAGLSIGGAMIMGTLAASASYITAPAVVGTNIPSANPGYYLTAALVITFPLNLTIGLPVYFEFAKWIA